MKFRKFIENENASAAEAATAAANQQSIEAETNSEKAKTSDKKLMKQHNQLAKTSHELAAIAHRKAAEHYKRYESVSPNADDKDGAGVKQYWKHLGQASTHERKSQELGHKIKNKKYEKPVPYKWEPHTW